MRKKRLSKISILLALVLAISGCGIINQPKKSSSTEINPVADAQNVSDDSAALYFANSDMSSLISETRDILSPVNERIEVSVLNELIHGPQRGEFKSLINSDTKVISVTDKGGFMFVTLSQEFLDFPETYSNEAKALAFYSVINTLIELTGFDRVQLLVDIDNSGNGQRIKRSQVGLQGNATVEPMGFNTDVIMTPRNTVQKIFSCLERKDYVTLYSLIATIDTSNSQKPMQDEFIALFSATKLSIESFNINTTLTSSNGESCIVFCDFVLKLKEQEVPHTNSPVRLIRENNIWKIRYSDFIERFLG